MTPAQYAKFFRDRARAIPKAVLKAEQATLADAQASAVRLSGGSFTSGMLRALKHPYGIGGVRGPIPYGDPGVVNSQSGTLRASWKRLPQVASATRVTSTLTSTDPKSKYLRGTRRMIARPIMARVVMAVRPARTRRLLAAMKGSAP